jgi:hypothetical protein
VEKALCFPSAEWSFRMTALNENIRESDEQEGNSEDGDTIHKQSGLMHMGVCTGPLMTGRTSQ